MKRNKRTHESMTTDPSPPPLPTSFVWIQGTHLNEGEAHTSASDSQARRAAEKKEGSARRAREKRE
jgi:hypothetical protein